jgi:hypothetical protein
LTNPAGQIDVPAGTAGMAPPDPKAPPTPTDQQPSVPPPPVSDATFRQSDKTTETGAACVVTATCESLGTPLISGPGFLVSFAYGTTTGASIGSSTGPADAVFNGAGQLTAWTDSSGITSFTGTHLEGTAVAGVMGWGRWIGSVDLGGRLTPTFGVNEGFHYVAGLPTASIPMSGNIPFTLIGATNPTGSDGTILPGTLTFGSLTADFTGGRVTVSLTPSFATWSYNVSMTANISGASMSGGGTASVASGLPPANYDCCGCSASFEGAFFGAGASHVGIAYQLSTGTSVPAKISGAAAFQQ